MVILVVFKVFLVVKILEILIQIVPEHLIYYYYFHRLNYLLSTSLTRNTPGAVVLTGLHSNLLYLLVTEFLVAEKKILCEDIVH